MFYIDKDLISEVSTLATGEYELEDKLRSIEAVWDDAKVEIVPQHSKSKSVFVLAGVSSLLTTACEHEVTLTNMVRLQLFIISSVTKRTFFSWDQNI